MINETTESRFMKAAVSQAKIVEEKNAAYGDSFRDSVTYLKLLWPAGVPVEAYADMLALVRDFDKCKRIATARDALGENPWRDKLGYALLRVAQLEEESNSKGESS